LPTSDDKKLATESSVGWSKSIIGDISSPDSEERVCTSSTLVIESKSLDINETLVSTDVPKVDNTMDDSILVISRPAGGPSSSARLSITLRLTFLEGAGARRGRDG
jgi:hypothetical protein